MNRKQCDALDVSFCRALLSSVHTDVKAYRPTVNLKSDAWTYHTFSDNWEFHGPDDFYWYGSAGNAFEARYKGWSAWLAKNGVTGYALEAA